MTIAINTAPQYYRTAFQQADANHNGEIDSQQEAESAAQEYCRENPNSCEELLQFLDNSGYRIYGLEVSHGRTRGFRTNVTFALSTGGEVFDYDSLPDSIRHVPPHPDDVGSQTEPIDAGSGGYFDLGLKVGLLVDFWQYVFLRYQMGFVYERSDNEVGSSSYGYPPLHRQQYASGENAFTFISLTRGPMSLRTHNLSLGTYLFRNRTIAFDRNFSHQQEMPAWERRDHEFSITLEGGFSTHQFSIIRGWDRYAHTEEMDVQEINIWGFNWAISFSFTSPGQFYPGISLDLGGVVYSAAYNFYASLTILLGIEAFRR
jgi:hypothetical protein